MPGLAAGLGQAGLAATVWVHRLTPALQEADLQNRHVGFHVAEDADILVAVPAQSMEGDGRTIRHRKL